MTGEQLWSLRDIADWDGTRSPEACRVALRRLGVSPDPDRYGRGGARLYLADEVRAAWPRLPGRGARTDLEERAGGTTEDQQP